MKKYFGVIVITFLFLSENVFAQKSLSSINDNKLNLLTDRSESQSFYKTGLALFPLNPILLVDNKKFYVGITKEVSFGFYPVGRISAEYSLIFRETHLNHLRFSYNYDFLIETGDFAALFLSAGGGYFTDFDKSGYFPQTSLGILFPITDNIATNPYVKFRYTFVNDNKGDLYDLSFGLGLYISP